MLFIPPTHSEQMQLLEEIQECIAKCAPFSRGVFAFNHGIDDGILPCVFDFLEARDCRVENVVTQPRPSGLYREILFKVCSRLPATGPQP